MSTSYLVVTQSPSMVSNTVIISTPSTTVASTSDWTNDGSGKYTYTGSIPQRFILQLDLNFTGLASTINKVTIIKNGIIAKFYLKQWNQSVDGTTLSITQSTSPFTMNNGNYIQLLWEGSTISLSIHDIKVSIVNVLI